jgi:hypothetical protein
MAERIRRMLGQGLNPFGKSKAWWRASTLAAVAPPCAPPVRTRLLMLVCACILLCLD